MTLAERLAAGHGDDDPFVIGWCEELGSVTDRLIRITRALAVAVAALRSADVREVRADDHAAVLKIWSKRHRDLGRAAPR